MHLLPLCMISQYFVSPLQMKPQVSPPKAILPFWKCRFCTFKTKHKEVIRGHESSRHRAMDPRRRIRSPAVSKSRIERPLPRMDRQRVTPPRRYIRRLTTPDLTNTRRIPTRPGPLPQRRRFVISPTPEVEIVERPSSPVRRPASEVRPQEPTPTFPSPIRTSAPSEEMDLVIVDEALDEEAAPPASPSPSLPDVHEIPDTDEDAISIAGSGLSVGTQAGGSSTPSDPTESATQTSNEQKDRMNRLMDECRRVCQSSARGSGHHRIAESQTFYQALQSGEGVGRTIETLHLPNGMFYTRYSYSVSKKCSNHTHHQKPEQ